MESTKLQTSRTINLEATMVERRTGSARISLTALAENSLPKTQSKIKLQHSGPLCIGLEHHFVAAPVPGVLQCMSQQLATDSSAPQSFIGYHILDDSERPGTPGEIRNRNQDTGGGNLLFIHRHEAVHERVGSYVVPGVFQQI